FAGQPFGLSFLQPLGARQRLTLGTVAIRAGVISVTFVPTAIAALQMASEGGRATAFDGPQHPPLGGGRSGRLPLAQLRAVGAHDVGDFQRRPHGKVSGAKPANPGREVGADPKGWWWAVAGLPRD